MSFITGIKRNHITHRLSGYDSLNSTPRARINSLHDGLEPTDHEVTDDDPSHRRGASGHQEVPGLYDRYENNLDYNSRQESDMGEEVHIKKASFSSTVAQKRPSSSSKGRACIIE